jgi:hypothetical protein
MKSFTERILLRNSTRRSSAICGQMEMAVKHFLNIQSNNNQFRSFCFFVFILSGGHLQACCISPG